MTTKNQKVLFIRYKKTKGVYDGGEMASQKHIEAIQNIVGEGNVDTIYIHDDSKRKKLLEYIIGAFMFCWNYYFGLTPSRVKKIVSQAQNYDIVFIDRSVFGIIAKKIKKTDYNGKVISFYHNVETTYFKAKLSNKPWRNIILKCIDNNDRYTAQFSDITITLNKRDEQCLNNLYGLKNNRIIPITFDDKLSNHIIQTADTTSKEPQCLFLGSYFPANVEGIIWFVNEVFPKVNIRLLIVGKGMNAIASQLNSVDNQKRQKIEVKSDVPDLVPILINSDAVILPIFSGSGMKVKTCESLMFGKNIFGTDEAFEGYDIDYDKIGKKCNSAEEFIIAIENLSRNPRPKFNKDSREAYLNKYTDKAVAPIWEEILVK